MAKQRLQTTAKLHWRARNKPAKTRPEPAFGWALIGWVVGRLLNHGKPWATRACDFLHVVDPGQCREFLFSRAAWVQDKRLKRRIAQIDCQHDNGAFASARRQLHPFSGRDFAFGSLQILLSPPNLGQSLLVIAAAKSTVLWPTLFFGTLMSSWRPIPADFDKFCYWFNCVSRWETKFVNHSARS